MPGEALPTVAAPAPTKEEVVAQILKQQEAAFEHNDLAERLKIGARLSKCGQPWNNPLFGMTFDDPSIEYTLAEMKVFVPLERDRMNYNWENKDKGTKGVVAANVHGLYAMPRGHGRRKPHMNLKQQAIKSTAIRIFKELFEKAGQSLKATCAKEEIEYLGIPDAMIPELGAKATSIAARVVKAANRARSRNNARRAGWSR